MKTLLYIDGFNLFYGTAKSTPLRLPAQLPLLSHHVSL
jgi:hypothetical protein